MFIASAHSVRAYTVYLVFMEVLRNGILARERIAMTPNLFHLGAIEIQAIRFACKMSLYQYHILP